MAYSTKGTHNRLQVIGRLGQDPEIRHTQSGKQVANISIATNEKAGQNEVTSWHKATLWEKKAEVVGQYCRKGSKIMVEGPLMYREYTDRDGNKRISAEIDVDNFLLLDSKEDGGGQSRSGGGQQQQGGWGNQGGGQGRGPAPADDDDDIPF